MLFVFAIVAIAVVGAAAVLATGRWGQLAQPERDRRKYVNPQAPVSSIEADDFRFGITFRGYRMDDVDEAIHALTETLRMREAQLAALSSTPAEAEPVQAQSPDSGVIADTGV